MIPSPLDAAARLAGCRGRVLLHAARSGDGDGLGRWSFAAAEPRATLIANGRSLVRLDETGRPARRFTADPFDAVQDFLAEHGCRLEELAAGAAMPAGAGGPPAPRVIGYLGYDLARVLAPRPLPGGGRPTAGRDTPDLWLGAYDAVVRWDGGAAEVIGAGPARARLAARLAQPPRPSLPPSLGPLVADDDGDHHLARIERIRDHLAAGDVSQVHLARRLVSRIASPGDALHLYAALAEVAPAPYGALLECDGVTIVAGSPERFLGASGDRAPPHPGAGHADLLRATFPGGSITGAPKLRAIEIIDELEPSRRGPYGGALGYFGAGGALELALAIRIGVIAGPELRVHAGGDIVAGADPAAELAETELEAAGWLAALDRISTR